MSSDSENVLALILITFVTQKTKTKQKKDQKVCELNHGCKTGTTKVHLLTYFQNFC